MNIQLNWYTALLSLAAIILLFTSSLLVVVREGRNFKANLVFALFLLVLASALLNDVLGENQAFIQWPFLYDYYGFCMLSLGPLLYLYILYLTKPRFQVPPEFLWHFAILLPFALLEWWLWNDGGLAQTQGFSFLHYPDSWCGLLLDYMPRGHVLVYLLLCVQCIRQHNQAIRELMSSLEQADLVWLRSLLVSLILLFTTWMALMVNGIPDALLGGVALLVSYSLSFKALGQKAIYTAIQPAKRYSNSPLTTTAKETLMRRIEACMQQTKPYLINGLTLDQLAERLSVTPHQLSQVLNEGFEENFYKFINRYRVEESKRLLLDPALQHYNLLSIGFEAGFNTKSTFNKVFKEITGRSPSEFQKENRPTYVHPVK